MDPRLSRQDWIESGLRTLAIDGAGALKIGLMAAAMGVSRGSFYWHFRDLADFRGELLREWRERTVDQIIQEFDRDPAGPGKLQRLIRRAFFGRRGLDRAIRIWAAEDSEVAAMVGAVDASRVAYMATLLIAAGVAPRLAGPRAAFIYWAYLGQPIVMDPASADLDQAALDDIADLFER
jgi:AcrR family transcriptional regulator